MGKQKTGLWLLGALLVAIVLGALTWFLLISPELDRASTASTEAESARSDNDLLELQIAQMQALEQDAPDWREQIAKISMDMPPVPAQSDLERTIVRELDRAGLPLLDLSFARASEVNPLIDASLLPPGTGEEGEDGAEAEPSASPSPSPSATATAEPAEGDDGAADDSAEEEPATETPEQVEAPFTGLYTIPVTVATEGDSRAVMAFLAGMRDQLDRFYTITNLQIKKAAPTEASPGRPALTEDKWEVQVSGLVFSLLDMDRSFPLDEEGEVPLFEGGTVPNPFVPLPGTEDRGDSA